MVDGEEEELPKSLMISAIGRGDSHRLVLGWIWLSLAQRTAPAILSKMSFGSCTDADCFSRSS